jgi:tetratricopeptide (TPR) repeat protein
LLFAQNTFQATLTVCVTLVTAFVVTGFASSAYHRERAALGVRNYNNGRALEAHGSLEPAIEEYRKALLFTPDKPEYRLSLATALLEAGRLNEAGTHLEQLLQEDPTSGPINILMGQLAARQHNLKQAIEYYQRGVYEYWPQSELGRRRVARWELANLLIQTGDRGGFIGELMQLYTNLPPNSTQEQLRVGFLLVANGATSEGSRIFQELIKQAPQNPEARLGMSEIYFSSGQFISARHELQRTIRLDPKNKNAIQMLALTNDVIDLDPALPYISSAEQLRRSTNLLSRVLEKVSACEAGSESLQKHLEEGRNLLKSPKKTENAASSMQDLAARIWSERATACGKATPQDRAVDTVFSRIGHE